MEDTADGVVDESNPVDNDAKTQNPPRQDYQGTIDSVDGRPSLPFSVAALAVSFAILYFTPLLDLVFGFGNLATTIDSGVKLIVAFFLAFGIGIFWEYIF